MHLQKINRASSLMVTALALTALGTVASGYLFPPSPTGDEGTQAHIFQLAIALLLPAGLLFLATADWTQAARALRPLRLPAAAVVVAFIALYYLEHVYTAQR